MPYVLSKLANDQCYTKYVKGADNFNQAVASVTIKGGAGVANKKTLMTPQGVVTKITDEQYELLKENKEFQNHLERGFLNVFAINPDVEKKSEKMSKDKSSQLTSKDFEEQGLKAPETGAIK